MALAGGARMGRAGSGSGTVSGGMDRDMFESIFGPEMTAQFFKRGAVGNTSKKIQRDWMPDFLQDSPLGMMQQGMLSGLFADINDPTLMNQDLASIGAAAQTAQRGFKANTRFRGSAAGEAISQGIGQGGTAMQSRRRAQETQARLQRALALSSGVTSAFTDPLMRSLGMAQGSYEGAMNRQFQKDLQPAGWEKAMAAGTGLLDSYLKGGMG